MFVAKKKTAAKKTNVKKAVKKASAKKASKPVKKSTPAKKTTAKKAAPAKKAAAKKAPVKKAPVKKTTAKKAAVKKSAPKKSAPKKVTARKAPMKAKPGKEKSAKAMPVSHLVRETKPAKTLDLSGFVTPLDDRLLVQLSGSEKMTAGGLYIPDTVADTSGNLQGVVVSVGRGHMNKKGHVRPMDVKVGDKIVFSQYAGSKIKIQNEDLIILREPDVMGIVSK